jgi:hypothetical protein
MGASVIPRPPMIQQYNLTHTMRMRFSVIGVGLTSFNVTYADLLDLWVMASSATVVNDIFATVKVRAVEVWSCPVQGGQPNTVTVIYDGASAGEIGDQQIHTDTSMGVEPAHVLAKPNSRSQARLFQVSSANNAFMITAQVGSVIDVELSYKQLFGYALAAQNAAVGATAGQIYLRGLDGLAASLTKALPSLGNSI